MAWNGSSGGSTPTVKPAKKAGKTSPALKGALAGLLVIAGAVAAFFYLMPNERQSATTATAEKSTKIKEVKPAAAHKAKEVNVVEKKEIPYWERATTNGLSKMQLMKWKHRHMPPACYTNDSALFTKPKYAIFHYNSENRIAGLLSVEPGTMIVGAPVFDEKFKQDFLKSLEEPIIVSEDDSEENKSLKRLVRETKIELKGRMDAGEDLCQIMTETHKELQRLSAMRHEFELEFRRLSKDDSMSRQDMNDYLSAANKVLEEKGVSPIKLGALSKRLLDRRKGFSGNRTK